MSEKYILKDRRFSHVVNDPKFKKIPRHEKKVKIDKRFQSMFTDDTFQVKYLVDKRGKKLTKTTSEDFRKFYDLSSNEESNISETDEKDLKRTNIKKTKSESKTKNISDRHQGQRKHESLTLTQEEKDMLVIKQISVSTRQKLKDMDVDYARGEGNLFSDSSSDESDSEDSEEVESLYHQWSELDKDAETTNTITKRLAICNMDWDRIRAVDLMMLFSSFLPAKGIIYSIVIYPSEFGLQRLAEEERNGPIELCQSEQADLDDSDSENEEGRQYHMERMREYQLKRLKYYYGVATFDSPETADNIYTNCNGIEYESSGIRIDLRFIDDNITFEQEPKDECNGVESAQKYEPLFFTNTALQQAKVELTWDETDPKRLRFTQKLAEVAKTKDVNDSDLEDLVALSSSEESENEEIKTEFFDDEINKYQSSNEDPISSYRKLLMSVEENEEKGYDDKSEDELEISWGPEKNESSSKISKHESSSHKERKEVTPFERLLQSRLEKTKLKKEKKLQNIKRSSEEDPQIKIETDRKRKKTKIKHDGQKNELELLLLNENTDLKHHFNLKKLKHENKKPKKCRSQDNKKISDDNFQVDVNDERFSALYSSHLFNIDPTDPRFHKTKGMQEFVIEKQKRLFRKRKLNEVTYSDPDPKHQKNTELLSLVKSVKNKSMYLLQDKLQ